MTIRMNYQGIEIFASSPQEAAALIRDLTTGQRIVLKIPTGKGRGAVGSNSGVPILHP